MSAQRPEPGTPIIFQWRKWDGSPHWRHECVYLGSDAAGDWVGQPAGWHSVRPGAKFYAETANVTVIPASGDYAATLYGEHRHGMRVYIDLGWDVRWSDDPLLATGIDMDLDVVRVLGPRGTWIDDEDEWAEHRVKYGYPDDVITHVEALAARLEKSVRNQYPPFDEVTAAKWLDRMSQLRPRRLDG